ncbi:MAG: T9SS type A sorting domain-containing protein [Bacteroidetes bacterium]|nr:T9SS type A sorting domain-containing protein [Bacteroidota bacterium]
MKKISTLLCLLSLYSTSLLQAQSQRLVLIEEFTNASCGPCASQNPTFNTLIGANTVKVVSIKYQTNFPGYDPMNVQTAAEVLTRQNYYYNLNGVPYGVIDGDTASTPLNGYYVGAPHNITQTTVNTKYAIASPYDVILTHSFSSDYDSIFITMNITNSMAVSGANKARIALVEKKITFATAPGTNGEKDFHFVMRKMYPTASGTLVTANALGQTQTITIAAAIPSYMYDFNQLAVVGFIQDDISQNIRQAAFSDVQPLADMVGIKSISGLQTVQCDSSYTPVITLKNLGTTQLTSCSIDYKFDANPFTSIPVSCNIAPGLTQVISLAPISTTSGAHDLVIKATDPNNINYKSSYLFNTVSKKSIVISNFNAIPKVEGFEGAAFPGAEWYIDNPDNGPTWTRKAGVGGMGGSSACAKMDIFSSANVNGQIDDFYAPALDLTNAVSPVNLDFNVAAAQKTATSAQKLEVRLSYNCGLSWTPLYSKTGATLATAPINANAFTPTASQWRTESIDLDPYIGQANVIVAFRATKNGGNNIYIDDVNFYDGTLKVKNVSKSNAVFNVYQISENYLNIKLNLDQAEEIRFEVFDILGKRVYSENKGKLPAGNQSFAYNVNSLSAGIYVVKLTAGSKVFNQKVNLTK